MSAEIAARIPTGAAQLADQALALYDEHREIVIATRPQFVQGADLLRTVKGLQKGLEAERTKVTVPMNEALRQVNDWFRGPAENLARAERAIKAALAKFEAAETAKIRAQEEEARRQAQIEQDELARRAAKATEKGNAEKAAELQARAAAVVPATAELAPVKAKAMAFTDVWDVTVVNAAAVPREYLMVDEAKLRAMVKASKGTLVVPGVRVTHRRDVRAGS